MLRQHSRLSAFKDDTMDAVGLPRGLRHYSAGRQLQDSAAAVIRATAILRVLVVTEN